MLVTEEQARPMMKCGCAANATRTMTAGEKHDATPACAIHDCIEIDDSPPDLDGRTARCKCGKTRPSSRGLPFFEYRGPGSKSATESCICGYHRIAHERVAASPEKYRHVNLSKCGGTFTPRGDMPDLFYCGHSGWD
jgi:hypothetical protein